MIDIRNLKKNFGPVTAVDGISFSVDRGEVLGFLGPNAAGKTTTMRMLACFLPPDEGEATVAGFDIAREPLEVRRRIGYLPENNPLYLDMEVTEYLAFIAEVRGLAGRTRRARLREMVEVCGLEGVLGRPLGTLSKGYRQRVGLAQTLIHDPDVLILDEPTTGLDPNQIIEIRELIRAVGRQKTIILSSHILTEVEATCERILIINRGRLVGSGTAAELSRLARGAESVHLVLRDAPPDAAELLATIPGVTGAAGLRGGEPGAFRIEATAGEDPREAIFRMAVERGWVMLEMRRESASLEDVFRALTTTAAGA
jgi:ABC-2 type transport system ATP-binding protein